MFTYPPEIAPNRYRFADVMLAALGPELAAERLRWFANSDVAAVALSAECAASLNRDADRFAAMAAMIVR